MFKIKVSLGLVLSDGCHKNKQTNKIKNYSKSLSYVLVICWQSLTFLILQMHHSNFCLYLHIEFFFVSLHVVFALYTSVSVSQFSLGIRTPVMLDQGLVSVMALFEMRTSLHLLWYNTIQAITVLLRFILLIQSPKPLACYKYIPFSGPSHSLFSQIEDLLDDFSLLDESRERTMLGFVLGKKLRLLKAN